MWLVGYLYNTNGMGTWCWEAANALHEAGEQVTLVCSASVKLPGNPPFAVRRIAMEPRPASVTGKIRDEVRRLSPRGPRVIREAVEQLARDGIRVAAVVLNATEFYDPDVDVPQLVVAWARGVTLRAYLERLREHWRGERGHHALRSVLGTVGTWRKDWYSYRRADVILAVTTPLRDELEGFAVRVALLHPCTASTSTPPAARASGAPTRLLIAAADLDDPRKRVAWMLDALRADPPAACTLTLLGRTSDALTARAAAIGIPVECTGALLRDDALVRMREHDILLFASELDDWGFVLTEAMAQGLAVVAPSIAPFDEILGDTGATYGLHDAGEFTANIAQLGSSLQDARLRSWNRARTEFSRQGFAATLRRIVAERELASR